MRHITRRSDRRGETTSDSSVAFAMLLVFLVVVGAVFFIGGRHGDWGGAPARDTTIIDRSTPVSGPPGPPGPQGSPGPASDASKVDANVTVNTPPANTGASDNTGASNTQGSNP